MNIVGVCGRMYSGKTTAANIITELLTEDNGFPSYKLAFADELKRIARDVFGWDGQKDERGRRLLQVIGTECGREYDPQFWVKRLDVRVHELVLKHDGQVNIAVDDCRFPNEQLYIESLGGIVIGLARADEPADPPVQLAQHRSEVSVDPRQLEHWLFNHKQDTAQLRRQLRFELLDAGLLKSEAAGQEAA